MKPWPFLAAPFFVVAVTTVILLAAEAESVSATVGVLFLIGFFGCLICVPIVSKMRLALGYLALVFPFAMLGIVALFSPTKTVVHPTVERGEIRWHDDPSSDDLLKKTHRQDQPNQAPQPTTTAVTQLKHPAAKVEVPGSWEKDQQSTDEELTLNSKPEGRQIIVCVLCLKEEPKNRNQAADIAAKIYEMRLKAFLKLSAGTAKFDQPQSGVSETGVVCLCRGCDQKNRVRMAVRIEASMKSRIVRSTSVYDYTGMSGEDFVSWSNSILEGVR